MWKYNYAFDSDEIYHHGILGMKWGVRRYQNTNGGLTSAGRRRKAITSPTKKLSPSDRDALMFGPKGAKRIAERQEKGKSRNYALNVERARQTTIGLLTTAAFGTVANLITSGKGAKMVSKGAKAVKDLWNSQFDSMVLDASGKVIGKYRNSVKNVANAVNSLVIRR